MVGAGIAGTTTAYELALDGHEVAVFERHSTVAEGTSFATGALVSPGWTADWAGARRRLRMPWTARHLDGLQLGGLPGPGAWPWLWQWAKAARRRARLPAGHEPLQPLLHYSHQRRLAIAAEGEFDHDRSQGLLTLWRSAQEAERAQPALAALREAGVAFRPLGPEEARAREPALNPETPLHGAIEWPGEGAASCRGFALLARNEAQRLGVRFEFGITVLALAPRPGDPAGAMAVTLQVPASDGPVEERFDAVVVCAGTASAALLRPLGLRVPLNPVIGCTLSAAVREPMDAPVSAVLDARSGVSIARLGQRVRVAGGHVFGTPPAAPPKRLLSSLYQVLSDWFPGAIRLAGPHGGVQEWQGVRGALPDGLALLGASRVPGLWLHLGQGDSGWAMACGAARVLADQLQGHPTEVDVTAFSPRRFGL